MNDDTDNQGPAQDGPEPADPGMVVEVEAPPPPPEDRVAALENALKKAEDERKDAWDKYVRALADLENYRRRSKRDLDDARADARTRVLKEILPVVDNLERAVAHGSAGDGDAILEGVRLVLRQFMTALERCEVTPVVADGQPFDPNLHEAISQQESDAPPGTVVSVLQKGYKLGDRLLRPSLVVVARARAGGGAAPEGNVDTVG
jgi:molecular chaperone GrpE